MPNTNDVADMRTGNPHRSGPAILARALVLILTWTAAMAAAGIFPSRAQAQPGGEWTLENAQIRATFDARGLVALTHQSLEEPFRFTRDAFLITIDGRSISNEGLGAPEVQRSDERLTYRLETPEYVIDTVYELKPGWRFVSKQLIVRPKHERTFRVDAVEVLDSGIEKSVAEEFVIESRRPDLGPREYGAFLRFGDGTGMLAVVQNPFLDYRRDGRHFRVEYEPKMEWKSEYGSFESDRGLLAIYELTGEHLTAEMVAEWTWTRDVRVQNEASGSVGDPDERNPSRALPGEAAQDWAEIDAFTRAVEAFILPHPEKPLNVHVGWTENDYQIDVATASGREEYKRIIDQAADLGVEHIVYAPYNSLLGNHLETADDWYWENLLWLGLGTKIRKGEWDPKTDAIPESIQTMLDYADARGVHLVAYMYPVMPFEGNPEWIVEGSPYHRKKRNASLGVRSFQDWLIANLSAFKERTGISGYAFDYTFLWYENTSRYEQWWGWRRVMETLRERYPDIVIDGRQLYHEYGPWSWLAGSYPHPTAWDEQPESFVPFPDMHFDRVSGNRQRYTAYRYRIRDYCPPELMPGFLFHQSPRLDHEGRLVREPFRIRDWDYIGWKYSLFSSIATAGLNNVIDMIPARDPEEYHHFAEEDKRFIRSWLDWTAEHREYLLNTRPIIGQPAIGRIDGTSAIVGDRGYLFLFNPNGRSMDATFTLDETIGLTKGGEFVLREVFPLEDRHIGKPGAGVWHAGDVVSIRMSGAQAVVLEVGPPGAASAQVFNVPGRAEVDAGAVTVTDVRGEVGSSVQMLVRTPGRQVDRVRVNGREVTFTIEDDVVVVPLRFAGEPFSQMEQVGTYDPDFEGGVVSGTFSIPQRVFEQLEERRRDWPIPWSEPNYDTPWLVPERLPMFVQIAEPSDTMDVRLRIDGEPVDLTPAYSSIRRHARSFVGFYADVSSLEPDREYTVELTLPKLKPGQFQGLFFENVVPEYTDELRIVPAGDDKVE